MGSHYLQQRAVRFVVFKPGPGWLERAKRTILRLDLDVLLYLDLTMSSFAHRLAMSRLAPVQAVSHGHPVTSGIPRGTMDYYISWAAAELPTAQEHYTEELMLLPGDTLHQYYLPRVAPGGGVSVIDGQPFGNLSEPSGIRTHAVVRFLLNSRGRSTLKFPLSVG